jgi:hypothetical protein
MTPEIWNADTGRMSRPAGFAVKDGRTVISIRLNKNDSRVVVFANEGPD